MIGLGIPDGNQAAAGSSIVQAAASGLQVARRFVAGRPAADRLRTRKVMGANHFHLAS